MVISGGICPRQHAPLLVGPTGGGGLAAGMLIETIGLTGARSGMNRSPMTRTRRAVIMNGGDDGAHSR